MNEHDKTQASLALDLKQILQQYEQEKEAEKKKNTELLEICRNLQGLLDETTSVLEHDRIAAKLKQETLETLILAEKKLFAEHSKKSAEKQVELQAIIDTGARKLHEMDGRLKDFEKKQSGFESHILYIQKEAEANLAALEDAKRQSDFLAKEKTAEIARLEILKQEKEAELSGRISSLENNLADEQRKLIQSEAEKYLRIKTLEEQGKINVRELNKQKEELVQAGTEKNKQEQLLEASLQEITAVRGLLYRTEAELEENRMQSHQKQENLGSLLAQERLRLTETETEKAALKAEAAQRQHELSEANEQNSMLKATLIDLEKEKAEKESVQKTEIESLRLSQLMAEQKQFELEGLLAAGKEQLADLRAGLNEKETALEQIKTEQAEQAQTAKVLRAEFERKEKEYEGLISEKQIHIKELTVQLETNACEAARKKEELEAKQEQNKAEIEQLRRETEKQEEEIQAQESQKIVLEAKFKKSEVLSAEKQQYIKILEEECEKNTGVITQQKEELGQIGMSKSKQEKLLQEKLEEIEVARERLRKTETELAASQTEAAQKQSELVQLLEQERQRLTETETEKAALKAEAAQRQHELSEANEQNSMLKATLIDLEKEKAEKESVQKTEIESLRISRLMAEQKQFELEGLLAAGKEQLADLRTGLNEKETALEQIKTEQAEQAQTAKGLRAEFERKEKEYEALISENQRQLRELRKQLEANANEAVRQKEELRQNTAANRGQERRLEQMAREAEESRIAAEQKQAQLERLLQSEKEAALKHMNDLQSKYIEKIKSQQLAFEQKENEFRQIISGKQRHIEDLAIQQEISAGETARQKQELERLEAERIQKEQLLKEAVNETQVIRTAAEQKQNELETQLQADKEAMLKQIKALHDEHAEKAETQRVDFERKEKAFEALAGENQARFERMLHDEKEEASEQIRILRNEHAAAVKAHHFNFERKELEFESHARQLKAEIEKLTQEVSAETSKGAELAARFENLEKEKNQNEKELKERAEGLEARSKEMRDYFYQQMEKRKEEAETLAEENLALKNENKQLNEENTKQISINKEQIEKNRLQKEDTAYQKEELSQKMAAYQARANIAEGKEKTQQEKYEALEAVKDTIFSALKQEKARLEEANLSSEMLQKKLAEAYEEIKENQTIAASLKHRLDELEGENKSKIKDILSENEPWKTKNAELLNESQKLSKAFQEEVKRTVQLEAELRKVQASLNAKAEKKAAPTQEAAPLATNKKDLSTEEKLSGLDLILALEDQKKQTKKNA